MDTILANDWNERLPDGYDVIVVGSGYGGSITAARLANADVNPRLKVCIVERGQEWPVGQFPDDLAGVLGASYHDVFNPLGLYEFDAFRDIAVIKGSGLGGTSLVNANVAIRPEPDTFADWPTALNQVAQIGEDMPGVSVELLQTGRANAGRCAAPERWHAQEDPGVAEAGLPTESSSGRGVPTSGCQL